jgi:glycosyltransferase involved in cell wall biosynthesis
MPTADMKVLFIGKTWDVPYVTARLEPNSRSLCATLATFRPDVIVTCGPVPASLNLAPFEVRKRWIHLDSELASEAVVQAVEACYQGWLWGHPGDAAQPLLSVYTATYDTGDFLRDTYHSLRQQTYRNWEWVVVDDGSRDGTWERLLEIAAEDFRVRPIRVNHLGKIGAVKRLATQAAMGPFLVELDHDDLLTADALKAVKQAFEADPETGMVYSNFAEFFQDGRGHRYEGAFWADRYRETEYQGRRYLECLTPDLYGRFGPAYTDQFAYFLTVGPNHVRAFRASELARLGGYNPNLSVADDWDLFARFFLRSKCRHIDRMLYLYRFQDEGGNTTFVRNKAIQDHLELGRRHYAQAFQEANERDSTVL